MGRMVRKQVYIEPQHETLLKEQARVLGVSEAEVMRLGIERLAGSDRRPPFEKSAAGGLLRGEEPSADDAGLEFVLGAVKRLAERRGIRLARAVREALEEWVAKNRPKPTSIGIFASGHTDTARRAGEEHFEPPSWR